MLTQLRRAVVLALFALVFLGLIYPLVGTGLSQLLFKHQADGSITTGGSTLIGQNWTSTKFFHGRPDNFGPYAVGSKNTPLSASGGDNPLVANGVSGGSAATNLGPRSQELLDDTQKLIAYWHSQGVNPTTDLVTTSGSGLDPDITPADAYAQIPMVSRSTGISPARLRSLIASQTHGAQFGFLGSPYVVLLQLNQAVARLQ
jgi:K+-transporting ATPase ATPase C chain